jgi:hypothetical protein
MKDHKEERISFVGAEYLGIPQYSELFHMDENDALAFLEELGKGRNHQDLISDYYGDRGVFSIS